MSPALLRRIHQAIDQQHHAQRGQEGACEVEARPTRRCVSATWRRAPHMSNTPMGTLMKNPARQDTESATMLPTTKPTLAVMPPTAPYQPRARSRCGPSVKLLDTKQVPKAQGSLRRRLGPHARRLTGPRRSRELGIADRTRFCRQCRSIRLQRAFNSSVGVPTDSPVRPWGRFARGSPPSARSAGRAHVRAARVPRAQSLRSRGCRSAAARRSDP
jgi:hypothetical protein